jgi:hypothetical protein
MNMLTKPPTWNARSASLCRTLRDRNGGTLPFTLARFRAWLTCESQNPAEPAKERLLWKCPYSGRLLNLSEIAIDHKQPMALGGTSDLGNLHVCHELQNRVKGKIPHEQYLQLRELVQGWPLEAATDLYGRLAAKKAWHKAFQDRRAQVRALGKGKPSWGRRGGK